MTPAPYTREWYLALAESLYRLDAVTRPARWRDRRDASAAWWRWFCGGGGAEPAQ
jgi:hypothetical protein